MIAQRFRALGWVGGIASAATGLYLISLQVAAERAKLEDVDRRIAAAQRDMRALQTELGTRASLRQLERFNGETLALAAPRAGQYLHGDARLAAWSLPGGVPAKGIVTLTATVEAASARARVAIPAIVQRPKPAAPRAEQVAYLPPEHPVTPQLQQAAFVPRPHVLRVAMVDRAVIDHDTMGQLLRAAAHERKRRP